MIVDGYVAVGSAGSDRALGPGGVVGFLESLASVPPRVQARAETDVVALRLETDALRAICEQNFAVLSAVLEYVARATADALPALVGFYLVCRGSVEVTGGPEGTRRVGQGGVPGLVSSLANTPAHAGARAAEPTVVLHASVESLLDVLEDHFEMAFGFLGGMAANVLAAEAEGSQPPLP